jgi:sec-independent protein translocase protein TatC
LTVLQDPGAGSGLDPSITDGGTMPLREHLSELRKRLLIFLVGAAATTVVAWFFYDHVVRFMISPYRDFLLHHPGQDISRGNLVVTGPLEGFTTRLTISAYVGLAAAAPLGLWEFWQFVSPGLRRSEKRYAVSFTASAVTLFALGVATAILVFPKGIAWLIGVSGSDIAPLYSPSKYFGLYAFCCLVFGAAFTYPVILVFLELVGVVSSGNLRRWRRQAIVAIIAVAALITPTNDPFSFLALALPLLVFYEGSILAGRLLGK